jgi:tetratricopeptide (TPR) repeat protein
MIRKFSTMLLAAACVTVTLVLFRRRNAPVLEIPSDPPVTAAVPPAKVASTLTDVLKVFAGGVTATIVLFFTAAIVRELRDDSIAITPFAVSDKLTKKGHSGTTMALRFIDALTRISAGAESELPRRAYTAVWQQGALELRVPEMQTNLGAIVAAVRRTFYLSEPPSFTCEISDLAQKRVKVTARVSGSAPFDGIYREDDLDVAVRDVARYFYRSTQPIVLAAYHCASDSDASTECLPMLDAIIAQPRRLETFYALNMVGLQQQRTDEDAAIETFTAAIEFSCDSRCAVPDAVRASAWSNRASLLLRRGRFRDAIEDFTKASRLAPDNAKVLVNLALAIAADNQIERAVNVLDHAIAVAPKFARAYIERGTLRVRQGRFREAVDDLGKAISLEPERVEPYELRAKQLRTLRRDHEADDDLRRIERLRRGRWSERSTSARASAEDVRA